MPLSKQNQNVKNNEKYTFMSALERLNSLIDEGTFVGFDENLYSKNIFRFSNYSRQLQHDEEQTKLNEGIISGLAKISWHRCQHSCLLNLISWLELWAWS